MLFPYSLRLLFARCALLSCALLACAAITACGGGGSTNSNTTATPTNTGTTETVAPVTVITTPPVTPSSTVSVPDGTKTVSTVTSAACANAQATTPPDISATSILNYRSSGANQNETSENAFTEQGEMSPADLGAGPYYASNVLTNSETDGVGIPVKSNSLKDTTFYHQLAAGQLVLIGYQNYRNVFGIRALLYTTKYSSALPYGLMRPDSVANSRLFAMTAGQTVTQSFTATTTFTDTSMARTVKASAQRIHFVGVESLNPGGTQTYTACKFTNTESSGADTQITTLWYLSGRGILLKSITETISASGLATEINTTFLVKAQQNKAVVFPTF